MKIIRVNLKKRGYDIVVGSDIIGYLGRFLKKVGCAGSAIVITNPAIKKLWGKKIAGILKDNSINTLFLGVADTEKSKSMGAALALLNKISTLAKSRKIFVIAFGGGVVGDVGGFVASLYKRGVPYIQLPTTLLAQVDSAIGGKVAIDLNVGKNLAGAFYQPRLVFSDTAFLSTLSIRQIKNGLSEIIKCAAIKDASLFKFLEDNLDRILRRDKAGLERVIAAASSIKAKIVEKDEFDKLGIRIILNYGHTIGHAIETAAGYSKKYAHGEAVSAGMVAANLIAGDLGLISRSAAERIEALLEKAGLPTSVKGVDPKKIYEAHLHDKKFTGRKNRFVLVSEIGRTKIVEGISEKIIRKAIDKICA